MVVRQLSVTPVGFGSDDAEALAAFAAAGVDYGTATAGGHAGPETDFAGAFFVMWAESGMHLS